MAARQSGDLQPGSPHVLLTSVKPIAPNRADAAIAPKGWATAARGFVDLHDGPYLVAVRRVFGGVANSVDEHLLQTCASASTRTAFSGTVVTRIMPSVSGPMEPDYRS